MYPLEGCKQWQPLAAGSHFAFWLILHFVTQQCWCFILYFNSVHLTNQFRTKKLQHMVPSALRITESLAIGSRSASKTDSEKGHKCLSHSPPRTLHAYQSCWSKWGDRQTARPQWQAEVPPPPPVTASHIAPPVEKCNHIFRKGGSSAPEKRVYRIHTHCHYPAQVVSPQYLRPLISSQCGFKAKKHTHVTLRVL